MNKSNPIGVRFRVDLLEKLKKDHDVESHQKALVFYENFFATHYALAKSVKSPLRDLANEQKKDKGLALKPTPKTPKDLLDGNITTVTLGDNGPAPAKGKDAILKQIEVIKAEKIPPERNTDVGRKSWKMDQQKRIQELKNQLNNGTTTNS